MIKLLIILSAIVLLVLLIRQHLLSVEMEYTNQLSNHSEQQSYAHQFDTFSLTNTDVNGEIQSIIHSPSTSMLTAEQVTLMDTPKFIMQREQASPIIITAKHAKIFHNDNLTSLKDDVKVVMSDKSKNNIIMTTEQLTINNITQHATTDSPATLVHAKGNMKGVGVEFNPNDQQIKFLSKVRGIYEH